MRGHLFFLILTFLIIIIACQNKPAPDLSNESTAVSNAILLIDDPHENPIEKQKPYFQEFHGLLHLINGLINNKQYSAIGEALPFLEARFRKIMFTEGWLGLENEDYRYRLAQLDKSVVDFMNAFRIEDYASMKRRYKEMHNAYTRMLDGRPEENKGQ